MLGELVKRQQTKTKKLETKNRFEKKKVAECDKTDRSGGGHNGGSTKHIPCRFYRLGACTAGDNCLFSHNLEMFTEKQICTYYLKSTCKYGSSCALLHPQQPLEHNELMLEKYAAAEQTKVSSIENVIRNKNTIQKNEFRNIGSWNMEGDRKKYWKRMSQGSEKGDSNRGMAGFTWSVQNDSGWTEDRNGYSSNGYNENPNSKDNNSIKMYNTFKNLNVPEGGMRTINNANVHSKLAECLNFDQRNGGISRNQLHYSLDLTPFPTSSWYFENKISGLQSARTPQMYDAGIQPKLHSPQTRPQSLSFSHSSTQADTEFGTPSFRNSTNNRSGYSQDEPACSYILPQSLVDLFKPLGNDNCNNTVNNKRNSVLPNSGHSSYRKSHTPEIESFQSRNKKYTGSSDIVCNHNLPIDNFDIKSRSSKRISLNKNNLEVKSPNTRPISVVIQPLASREHTETSSVGSENVYNIFSDNFRYSPPSSPIFTARNSGNSLLDKNSNNRSINRILALDALNGKGCQSDKKTGLSSFESGGLQFGSTSNYDILPPKSEYSSYSQSQSQNQNQNQSQSLLLEAADDYNACYSLHYTHRNFQNTYGVLSSTPTTDSSENENSRFKNFLQTYQVSQQPQTDTSYFTQKRFTDEFSGSVLGIQSSNSG
ncbi:Protein cps3 [Zancudomyces culisetae]|uniref:Protein cps3 n=1 Tax=Zancudomyces culisetae TaxID=1213189 RepID=A0A1R1PWD0_ZANCU|nr:Protein cps3 [Zancudomyces culisetae]|eukprot:OMH85213.1 Protein cps3 [Zancudomyces culisetae]